MCLLYISQKYDGEHQLRQTEEGKMVDREKDDEMVMHA